MKWLMKTLKLLLLEDLPIGNENYIYIIDT
jgi:hypothetical protein